MRQSNRKTVFAIIFALAMGASNATAQAAAPSVHPNLGGLAAETNRCSPGSFKGEWRTYLTLYREVQHQQGRRAPGRNIACDGVLTKQGLRPASVGEVDLSAARLKGMLIALPSNGRSSTGTVPAGSVGNAKMAAIATCESHNNPRAIGGGGRYRGMYQMTFSIWAAVGGHGDPAAASPQEQTMRAQMVYDRYGAGQWPVCGR